MRATITAPAAQIASERRFINMSLSNSIAETNILHIRYYSVTGAILQSQTSQSQHGSGFSSPTKPAHKSLPALLPPSHAFFVACLTLHAAHCSRRWRGQRAARPMLHKPQKSRRTGGSYLNIMCSYSIPPARLMQACQHTGGNPIGTLC